MARSRSSVRIFNGAYRNVEGLAKIQAMIAAIPPAVIAEVKPALDAGADQFIGKLKPIVPVSELSREPGNLRDSVRKEDGDTDLSVRVIEDGQDEHGKPIAKHVEGGHTAKDGSHVAAVPHFWPAFNVVKALIKARVSRAMTKGIKAAFPQ